MSNQNNRVRVMKLPLALLVADWLPGELPFACTDVPVAAED